MWVQLLLCASALVCVLYHIRPKRLSGAALYVPPESRSWLGSLYHVLANYSRHHDWKLDWLRRAESEGKEVAAWCIPASPPLISCASTRMVTYILRDGFDNFEKGDVMRENFGCLLGDGIFVSDGASWHSQRKVASHLFSSRHLNEHMLDVFVSHATVVLDQLRRVEGIYTAIDMQDVFSRYTLDCIARIAFGVDVHALESVQQPAFALAFDEAQTTCINRFMVPPHVWKAARMMGIGREGALPKQIQTVNEFVLGVVRARRENLAAFADSGDLLSLFLADAAKRGEELSDSFLRDVVLNFLIAGRDTTAATLSWLFKALAEHPDIERRVCDELHEQLGADDGEGPSCGVTTEAQARSLPFLEATILETTRLWPPVAGDVKWCVRDCTLPDGTHVPKGCGVEYAPYVLNRLHSIWGPDADQFKPDRWIDEDTGHVKQPSPFKFTSFNAGPRLCLGKSMALLEVKVLASAILQRYSLRLAPGADLSYRISVVLTIKDGLPMLVRGRQNHY